MALELHPDANLISALIEGGLQEPARRDLIEHLSRCAACRQWAACALDVVAPGPVPAAKPAAFTGRVWAWEAPLAAAAMLALVAGGLWWRSATVVAPATPMALSQPGATAVHHLASLLPPPLGAQRAPAQPKVATPPPLAAPANLVPVKDAALNPSAMLPPAALRAPAATVASVQPSLDFSPALTGFRDQAPLRIRSEMASLNPATAAAVSVPVNMAPVISRPPAVMPPTFASSLMGSSAQPSSSMAAFGSQGGANNAVNVGLNWAVSRSGSALRSAGADLWSALPFGSGHGLQLLATTRDSMWAAGDSDQLLVSRDHGTHWIPVELPGLGQQTEAVRSIVFVDNLHGVITVADGRTWQTANGGKSWAEAGATKPQH